MKDRRSFCFRHSRRWALLFLLLLLPALFFFAEWRTDGFRLAKLYSFPKESPESSLPLFENKISKILKQKFTYLGKGRQCFVFESEDQQYVLKFFNRNRFQLPFPFAQIPLPSPWKEKREEYLAKRKQRLPLSFTSYQVAFEKFRKLSGILFVHLEPMKVFPQKVALIDRQKNAYLVDLSSVAFLLQRKVKPFFASLEEFYQKEGEKGLEKGILSFLELLSERISKGFVDDDVDIAINYGFVDHRAICFDMGRLSFDSELLTDEGFYQEMERSLQPLRKWLQAHHPDSLTYLEKSFRNL